MTFESYLQQLPYWPKAGRHILAHYNDTSIVVYQAYNPRIARYAVAHQRFGGEFRYTRMSWLKPNFLWMMYRSGWAELAGQECILAIRLPRAFFDRLLELAVWSSFHPKYATHEAWKQQVSQSQVRLQWDPDHTPTGARTQRRALQLGLRGNILHEYGNHATWHSLYLDRKHGI